MNSVEFFNRGENEPEIMPNYGSTLTAFHEMGHYWGVWITAQSSIGPREWNTNYPLAYLASCCGHWTWVWNDNLPPGKMPGIMGSGPTSTRFNAFDLYFMGLMDYDEASTYTYGIYDLQDKAHSITLDSLRHALSLAGEFLYDGDGKRIPGTDAQVKSLNTLIVVVKGAG